MAVGLGLRRRDRDSRLEAAHRRHPSRLGNLAQIVGGPERDPVFPRHQRESRGITPMIVRGSPSTWIDVPMTSVAPPSRRCHVS
jgi:hypothetical protein